MIIVDTSVWIDYFKGISNAQTEQLDRLIESDFIAIGDIIWLEILQGIKSDKEFNLVQMHFAGIPVFNLLGKERVVHCAQLYRKLRQKGITIRKTTDVIIASFCIENNLRLLHTDRDFKPFEDFFDLNHS